MKRHVQETGIRKWFGNDFLELQSQPLKAIDDFFKPYASCIISGCEVSGDTIASGLVAFVWDSQGVRTAKVVPFPGASGLTVWPQYLYLQETAVTREYQSGGVKNIAFDCKAAITSALPVEPFVRVLSTGPEKTFRDVLQSSNYRLCTDAEKATWNAKLAASAYTASDILAKLLTVDGHGSGLNADMIDGIESERIVYGNSATGSIGVTDVDAVVKSGFYYSFDTDSNPTATNYYVIHNQVATGDAYAVQIAISMNGAANSYARTKIGGVWGIWAKIYNVLNDGAGSLIDADFLDGKHSTDFLLLSAYTASDILTKLLTVDGSGTGLDADKVDGIEAERMIFGDTSSGSTAITDANSILKSGFYRLKTPFSNGPTASDYNIIHVTTVGDSNYGFQIAALVAAATPATYIRNKNAGTWSAWVRLFNTTNDGAGSLLDADLFDGEESAAFAKLAGAAFTGNVSTTGYSKCGSNSPSFKVAKLTGTTATAEGGSTNIAYNTIVSPEKIIGCSAIVWEYTDGHGSKYLPNSTEVGKEYEVQIGPTVIAIKLSAANSENILSKKFVVLLTYEE